MPNCSHCGNEFSDGKKSGLCPDCRSAQGRRSKRKGAANELRFAKKMQEQFDKYGLRYRVRRTPRSGAIHDFEPADLMFAGLPYESVFRKHFELKNSHTWAIEDWYEEAARKENEQGSNREPILIIRKPNSLREYAVMDSEALVQLLISLELARQDTNDR